MLCSLPVGSHREIHFWEHWEHCEYWGLCFPNGSSLDFCFFERSVSLAPVLAVLAVLAVLPVLPSIAPQPALCQCGVIGIKMDLPVILPNTTLA